MLAERRRVDSKNRYSMAPSLHRAAARALMDLCEPRRLLASVSGIVFNDANKNGTRDGGEAGVSGITVFADRNYDGVMQSTELRTTTDANGFYRIAGIVADGTSTSVRLSGIDASRVTAPAGGGHSARFASDYEAANRNFGVAPVAPAATGVFGGRIRRDLDGNGSFSAGDGYLDGVRVYADENNNGQFDVGERSAISNLAGEFALTLEANRSYLIRGTLAGSPYSPAEWHETSPGSGYALAVYLSPGQVFSNGYLAFAPNALPGPTASITGIAFDDANKNGTRDAGESTLPGVLVYADFDRDGVRDADEPYAGTDAAGAYLMAGVPLSSTSIIVRAVAPAGYAFAAPADGALWGKYPSAGTYPNRNFGLAPATTPSTNLDVRPFYDNDGSAGPSAGDTSSSAFSLWIDANGNGLLDAGEQALAFTGQYDGAGLAIYRAAGVAPGTYAVAIRRPGDVDSYADYTRTFAAGGDNYFVVPTTSSLGGVVYRDANGNGAKDAGESGTAGVTVFADYDFDGVRDANEPQTTTNASGVYKLYGIRSDNNPFRITALVSGATFTQPAAGYYQARFDRAYDLADQGGRDFGYTTASPPPPADVEPARDLYVSGLVTLDVDRDGFDFDDPGLAGVSVFFDQNGNGAFDAGEPTDVTSPLGVYEFFAPRNVRPPAGAILLVPGANPNYVVNSTAVRDFSLRSAFASLSGVVYADKNGNGVRDAGEGGLAGRTVFADYNFNGALDGGEPSATTDANGVYRIVGVGLNRSYSTRVQGAAQTGGTGSAKFLSVYDQAGRDLGVAGASAPGTTTLAGYFYADANKNGVRDGGEGAGGGIIFIDGNANGYRDPGERYDEIAVDGRYEIAGVTSGTSNVLRFEAPDATEPPYYAPRTVVAGTGATTDAGDFVFTPGSLGYLSVQTNFYYADVGRSFDSSVVRPLEDVWLDLNNDGVRQGNEPRATVRTEFNGAPGYTFRLPAGTYTVAVRFAGDADVFADDTRAVTVTADATTLANFQAPYPGPAINGTVYDDINGNGVRDAGELPRFNALVYADYNMNGRYDLGDAFLVQYAGPSENPYWIGLDANRPFVLRAYESASAGDAGRPSATSYAFPSGLAAGARLTGYDFAVPPPAGLDSVVVTGTAYVDANGNGRRDAGEQPLVGRRVFATDSPSGTTYNAEFDAAAITGSDGRYTLTLRSSQINASAYVRLEGYGGAQVTQPRSADGSYFLGAVYRTYVINRDFGVLA